jgi:hypothetical protein
MGIGEMVFESISHWGLFPRGVNLFNRLSDIKGYQEKLPPGIFKFMDYVSPK